VTQAELLQRFPKLQLIKSPPGLARVNGIGTTMFGKRDYDSDTDTYVSTLCFSVLFIPLICLRAYRVAKARSGGWYFIGREPLSTFAKSWNLLLVAGIAATLAGVQYSQYISTPGYQAKMQMTRAHNMVAQGKLADAAKTYQTLVTTNTPEAGNAAQGMKDLLAGPLQQASLSESAGVISAATQVARRGESLPVATVADAALKIAAGKGDSDPRNAVAMLDTVRPLVIDSRPIDEQRFILLQKWAAREPGNTDVAIPLASLYADKGQLDEAKKLLLPIKDKLGNDEGARVLGTVLSREGDQEGAYALLWPYVKARMDTLRQAEQGLKDTIKSVWDHEINILNSNGGPADFYTRYNAAGTAAQDAMVQEYINGKIKDDPRFLAKQEELEHSSAVVPVALELGMVMLQRAQGQKDADVRKTQLKATEEVFLSVSGMAGKSDTYRLSLGQVYYWLSRQSEGKALFDDYLATKGRGYIDLMTIAGRLRQLGDDAGTRTLLEEAFKKASKTSESSAAAHTLSMLAPDRDEEIKWLNQADGNDPEIKAALASALGSKAFEQGHDDQAAAQFRAAVDAYAAMPRSATTLNQAALAYYYIFSATGDRQAFDRAGDYFQQAVALNPSDSILLYNAGYTLLNGTITDIIGNDIDLHLLHDLGSMSMLGYLYHDQAGRDAVVKRVKAHPGIARALGFCDKVMVLSPKNARSYEAAYAIYSFFRDEEGLKSLEERIRTAEVDPTDEIARMRKYIDGTRDAAVIDQITASLKRSQDVLKTARAKGGLTAAAAIENCVSQMIALDAYGAPVDTAQMLAMAQEAVGCTRCSNTEGTLRAVQSILAVKALRHANPSFDAFYRKYGRTLGPIGSIVMAADQSKSFSESLRSSPEIHTVLETMRQEAVEFPESRNAYEWALLTHVAPAEAETVAEHIRNVPRSITYQLITQHLSPASGSEACETYWLLKIFKREDDANAVLQRFASRGFALPTQP